MYASHQHLAFNTNTQSYLALSKQRPFWRWFRDVPPPVFLVRLLFFILSTNQYHVPSLKQLHQHLDVYHIISALRIQAIQAGTVPVSPC